MVLELTGVCYGTNGDNLPPPSEAIALCQERKIKKMRIFAPDEDILSALKGSNIELILGIPNSEIQKLADPSFARIWAQKYVLDFWPEVEFRYIVVGDEILPRDAKTAAVAKFLLPAMKNIRDVLSSYGIGNQVKVSTTTGMGILGRSYPPSAGAFLKEASSFICPIVHFLRDTDSPLLLNVDPYSSYIYTGPDMSISYALFANALPVVIDRQYKYRNLFYAMLDAMYWALEKANAPKLKIVVSAIGWPSEGGERGASYSNALTFYSNLTKHVQLGTPRRPRRPIETYLSSLFDENEAGKTEIDRHFGLFFTDKRPKYPMA